MKRNWRPYARAHGKNDNVPTPEEIYKKLDEEFHFNCDPCPLLKEKGLRQFDGLGQNWGTRNFLNPPYSEKALWIKRAIEEQIKGNLTVMLLPVDTSTAWFHDLILPHCEIRWVRGRVRFTSNPPPFASMICIFRPTVTVSFDTIPNIIQRVWGLP